MGLFVYYIDITGLPKDIANANIKSQTKEIKKQLKTELTTHNLVVIPVSNKTSELTFLNTECKCVNTDLLTDNLIKS